MPRRQEMWERLGPQVDLLVVGGGITGVGIARDAARRGLVVALVEMCDLAYGTSSRSSKLIHGGLRYLESYEFSLVFEGVSERRILMDIAPHLVKPLGFLFPVYKGSSHQLWFINAGMWVYEGLSLFRSPQRHRKLTPADLAAEEPALRQEGLQGAPLYFDCSTDDARLTLENAIDASIAGAVIATWSKARSFLKDEAGRVIGAVVEDTLTGALKEVRAHTVINATGPWTDRTIALSRPLTTGPLLRPTRGVHLVVDYDRLPVNHAVVCFHPGDGRALFAIPWGDRTYIGTTDTDHQGDPDGCLADRDDIAYLLEASNAYFPEHQLSPDDVIATWGGLRPLIRPVGSGGEELRESAVSREHQIVIGQDGMITIAGGKLTTYRRMAAEVVDTAVNLLRLSRRLPGNLHSSHTEREPLPGAVGWPEDDDVERVARHIQEAGKSVERDTAQLLANTYGMRGLDVARMVREDPKLGQRLVEGRPEILAQVDWAVRKEFAATVSDVLIRRTQIFFRDRDQGLAALDLVAGRMAGLIGWDEERKAAECERYRGEVGCSRSWRDE